MRNRANITAEEVRAMLEYNENTGEFRWKPRPPHMFTSANPQARCDTWNTRYAGKRAGTPHQMGYLIICIYGVDCLAHRLAFLMAYGRWPEKNIDHINGDTSDNRLCNLREATPAENSQNFRRPAHNTSGYLGVFWYKKLSKWGAQISASGKRRYLGSFDTKEAAYAAYLKAKAELHSFQPTPRGDRDEQAA